MDNLNGNKVILSGLVSSKLDLDGLLIPIRTKIKSLGGNLVGELIQRRGVSRSKGSGGSKKLDQPLSRETYISSGKVDELILLTKQNNCDLILFVNDLSEHQKRNLEVLIGVNIDVIK